MKLLQHWQDMAEKGMDPMWIDKENQKKSQIATFKEICFYGDMIAKSVAKNPVATAATAQRPVAR